MSKGANQWDYTLVLVMLIIHRDKKLGDVLSTERMSEVKQDKLMCSVALLIFVISIYYIYLSLKSIRVRLIHLFYVIY